MHETIPNISGRDQGSEGHEQGTLVESDVYQSNFSEANCPSDDAQGNNNVPGNGSNNNGTHIHQRSDSSQSQSSTSKKKREAITV